MRIPNEETTDRMAARARDALLARRLWRGCAGAGRFQPAAAGAAGCAERTVRRRRYAKRRRCIRPSDRRGRCLHDQGRRRALYPHLRTFTGQLHHQERCPGPRLAGRVARAYAPGKCIGGSRFGNYEGLLPEADGRTYTECDIDTLGADSRGAKRIVFSNDGLIYYTEDHYKSFELLYGEE